MSSKPKNRNIKIEKVVYRGFGMGHIFGKPAFIPHVYPNESVSASIRRKGRKVFNGSLQEIVEHANPERRETPCEYSGICGGCHHQEINYNYQLQLKIQILKETLSYIGKIDEYPEIRFNPSPNEFRYRPQCGFQVKKIQGVAKLGYFAYQTQNFIHIKDCLLLIKEIVEIKLPLEEFINQHFNLFPEISYVDIRMKHDGSQLVLTMGFLNQIPQQKELILKKGKTFLPMLTGILFKAWKQEELVGNGTITEEVLDASYDIGAGSFFQNNVYQWPLIQKLLRKLARITIDDTLLDLFCGVGFWSVGVGRAAEMIMGYEFNERSIEFAKYNALINGLTNTHFEARDLSQGLGRIPKSPSIIIINPPRSGCSRRLINEISEIPVRKIIYVSCDPPSLARDISRLKRKGKLVIESIDFIDMFPQTYSIETAVSLIR